MENVPLSVEDDAESREARRKKEEEAGKRLKKPENIGFLAVESDADRPPALEAAWAKTKREAEPDTSTETRPAKTPPSAPVEAIAKLSIENPDTGGSTEAEDRTGEPLETPPVEVTPSPPIETIQAEDTVEDTPPVPPEAPRVETDELPVVSDVVETAENRPAERIESADEVSPEDETVEETVKPEIKPVATPPKVEVEVTPPTAQAETKTAETAPSDGARAAEAVPDDDETPTPIPSAETAPPEERRPETNEPGLDAMEALPAPPTDRDPAEETAERPRTEQIEPVHRQFEFREEAEEEEEEEHVSAAETGPPEPPRLPEHLTRLFTNTETAPGERPAAFPETAPAPETVQSSRAAEEKMDVEAAPQGPLIDRHAEVLDLKELMELAEKIHIDGDNLRHIYETRLVGERGLRRLVAEYQRGGDLRHALEREILEREMDFERDPAMRDLAAPDGTTSDLMTTAEAEASLQKLLEDTSGDTTSDTAETAAFLKARTTYEASGQRHQAHYRKAILDLVLFGFITLLALLVIIVYLRR